MRSRIGLNTGDVIRVVHASGSYRDYEGVGLFAGKALAASEKGDLYTSKGVAAQIDDDPLLLTHRLQRGAQAGNCRSTASFFRFECRSRNHDSLPREFLVARMPRRTGDCSC